MFYDIVLKYNPYLCDEFFMVLDFKVNVRIDCRDDNQFFISKSKKMETSGFR